MPRVAPKHPEAGTNPIADAIRERRGARGLTPLDQTLLNAPNIAEGWNKLLGAIRTKNSLPGDVRELMILRVAARNSAAFEWIHHEHVGRDEGLSVLQLAVIRDTSSALPTVASPAPFSSLQAAALQFADASTFNVKVPLRIVESLRSEIKKAFPGEDPDTKTTEAAATVGTYNLVSRFLVATDVGDHADESVPFPSSKTDQHSVQVESGVSLNVVTHRLQSNANAPWILFVNSLMTNLTMWDPVVARLSTKFNIITFDQRGHGKSSVPPQPCTIDQLANDIATILSTLKIETPIRAVVGVSQGGATTLGFSVLHSDLAEKIVACDTQIKSPAASKGAWDERIAMAKEKGMDALAEVTLPRWFSPSSVFVTGNRSFEVREMVNSTPFEGFVAGARALQSYDFSDRIGRANKGKQVLLLAGQNDGLLPAGLEKLAKELQEQGVAAEYASIAGSGHLPMLDGTAQFLEKLEPFLLK